MSLRARLGTTVGTLTLALALVAPAPSVAGPIIGPGPLDPIIELLPPLPVPHTPYTGAICPDGADACIDEVIAEMETRLDALATSCHHASVFSLAYLRVTENVQAAQREGYFADRVWLNQVDAVFADLYFDVLDAWRDGRTDEVPKAWQITLKAEDDRKMTGLGNFMLAMNAHINRDFPHVLATVGLTAADGTSHKPDHNRYNARLDSLYGPVFHEEAQRFDPTFDDIDIGPIEETAAGIIMRGWREIVWRHAEALVLAKTPAQRARVEKGIELYAAGQAQVIRGLLQKPGGSSKRDAWCAGHGG